MFRSAWLLSTIVLFSSLCPGWADDKPLTRIALGSCANQDNPLPIFDTITEFKPELLLLLGDNMYADLARGVKVTPEVIQEKYDILGKLPEWQRLVAASPNIMATWDDHDYGLNDAGAELPFKKESQKLFLDFFGVPEDSPRRQQEGVYDARIFGPEGKRVQVIMLDCRYFRSPLYKDVKPLPGTRLVPYVPNNDPDATILGKEQWDWLEKQLKEPAEIRLIGSGIQVIPDEHAFEKWTNIPAERHRLYKLIRDTGANGVIFLSGDRHHGELSLDTEAVDYPLFDLTSSGLNQGWNEWRAPEKNSYRVGSMPSGNNFGTILIDWSGKTPNVKLQLRDEEGEVTVNHAVPISVLGSDVKALPLPKGVLSAPQALKQVGQTVTVQFRVRSGRDVTDGKRTLLNSDANFNSVNNFTVVVNEPAKTGNFAGYSYDKFKGKIVRVKGTVTTYRDAPQIEVSDPSQIELVPEG